MAVIAVDTNIVVRLLTRDDEVQYVRALRTFSSEEILLTETVILETEWVLRHAYGLSFGPIAGALRKIVGLPNVRLSDAPRILLAIEWHERGLDFADALHLAGCQTAESLVTFDKRFIDRAADLGKCRVTEPS